MASLLIFSGGSLEVDSNFYPSYIGGQSRPLLVPPHIKLAELQSRVLRALKYQPGEADITIVCRVPVGASYIATSITDDEACKFILQHATEQILVLYVEIEQQSNAPIRNVGSSSTGNQMEGQNEEIDEFSQDRSMNEINDVGEGCAEEYDTMTGGSSEDSSESDGEEAAAGDTNIQQHLIQDYAVRTANTENQMIVNNEYVRACMRTIEWDQEIAFDGVGDNELVVTELEVPTELVEGMCYRSKNELQFAVQGWSIMHNVEYQVVTSSKLNYTVVCTQGGCSSRPCQWRLHGSCSKRLGGAWKISKLSADHTCVNSVIITGHRQCNARFISNFIIPVIRHQMDIKPREIIGRMEAKFNIRVSYMKAWDARRKAIKSVFGSWEESYQSLYLFMDVVAEVMPGTVYRIHCNQQRQFLRIFWAFGPSISGWGYCRPVLCVDGTFLLGKYRGTLLTAVGIDANNGLFPLAFAVVEAESVDSWVWFFSTLHNLIPFVASREDLCVISDRHAGIVRACRDVYPWAAHRHCLRHLRENFKKAVRRFGIADAEFMCQKMYMAGNTDELSVHERLMTDIKNVSKPAYDWLIERDVSRWALLHDGGYRYGTMTTNASECFNGVLKRARGLPIQALITAIYYNIIGLFMKRLEMALEAETDATSRFANRITEALHRSEQVARRFPVPIMINRNEVQVFDMASRTFRIELHSNGEFSCSCNKPSMYHMPCAHVIVAAGHMRMDYCTNISTYYTWESFKSTYSAQFHVIPDRSSWRHYDPAIGLHELRPPTIRRRSGRPRTARFRNSMDEPRGGNSRVCGLCKATGHNRKTCPRKS